MHEAEVSSSVHVRTADMSRFERQYWTTRWNTSAQASWQTMITVIKHPEVQHIHHKPRLPTPYKGYKRTRQQSDWSVLSIERLVTRLRHGPIKVIHSSCYVYVRQDKKNFHGCVSTAPLSFFFWDLLTCELAIYCHHHSHSSQVLCCNQVNYLLQHSTLSREHPPQRKLNILKMADKMHNTYYNTYDACGHRGPSQQGRSHADDPNFVGRTIPVPTSGLCPQCEQRLRAESQGGRRGLQDARRNQGDGERAAGSGVARQS